MPEISPALAAGAIFLAVYVLIVTERIHRTLAANIPYTATMMSESHGHPIRFTQYLRYGVPATVLTMAVATVDILIRTAGR